MLQISSAGEKAQDLLHKIKINLIINHALIFLNSLSLNLLC